MHCSLQIPTMAVFFKTYPIKVGINKYDITSQHEGKTESEKENIRKGDFCLGLL